MLLILHHKGALAQIIKEGEVRNGRVWQYGRPITSGLGAEYIYAPDQDTSRLFDQDGAIHGMLEDLIQYTTEEKAALADKEKADAINAQVHPLCP
jgi:hypothetical protein